MVDGTLTDRLTVVRPRAEKVFVRNLALLEQQALVRPAQRQRRRRPTAPLFAPVTGLIRVLGKERTRARSCA